MVNQLMGLGISLLAIELANSWGTLIISYPQLMGVRSYTGLQSAFTSIVPSKNLNSLSSGGRLWQKEVQNILEKHAMKETTPRTPRGHASSTASTSHIFQAMLPMQRQGTGLQHRGRSLQSLMTLYSKSGLIGVINGILILFKSYRHGG